MHLPLRVEVLLEWRYAVLFFTHTHTRTHAASQVIRGLSGLTGFSVSFFSLSHISENPERRDEQQSRRRQETFLYLLQNQHSSSLTLFLLLSFIFMRHEPDSHKPLNHMTALAPSSAPSSAPLCFIVTNVPSCIVAEERKKKKKAWLNERKWRLKSSY